MRAERVSPAREEDVRLTMTAEKARSLLKFLDESSWQSGTSQQVRESLRTVGIKTT